MKICKEILVAPQNQIDFLNLLLGKIFNFLLVKVFKPVNWFTGYIMGCEFRFTVQSTKVRKKISDSSDRVVWFFCQFFVSKKTGKPLTNADLYKVFFAVYDRMLPKIVWVKGHTPKGSRDTVQMHFSHVDKAVRKELRSVCATSN